MKKRFYFCFVAVLLVVVRAPTAAAENEENWNIVTSIKYQFVPRPDLPKHMAAPQGTQLRFINIKAIDDFVICGALWEPQGIVPSDVVAFLYMPGSGGNYHSSGIVSFLPKMLLADGYAALAINTRQHDQYVNTDSLLDIRKDIEAAIRVLEALGYEKIVLFGHSLGGLHAIFYEAVTMDPAVKGLIATGIFANLPWKSRHILNNNETRYRELSESALEYFKTGRRGEILPIPMMHTRGRSVKTTAQHFLTYRYTPAPIADGTQLIRRVPVPILVVRDEGDAIIEPFEPNWLISSANAPGSLVPDAKFVLIPNPNGQDPEGEMLRSHGFEDNKQELPNTVRKWMREHGL
ncbi:alpha/beta hydrolase [Acidobacteria bacterium AH-259-D05]|nr:alpha/beta hydrolase [Acidobacteria bacterium AH-259-D05]